jgi:hypothetical protein
MKDKRGSHIDVILSFVIFISFIVFFYAMIQPNITSKADKTAFLDYMGAELIKNLTGNNLTAISIHVEPQSPHSCLRLGNFMSNAGISSMSLVLKNLTGATFPTYKSGSDLYIDMSQGQSAEFFKAYYSPSFNLIAENTLGNCDPALTLDTLPNSYSINKKEDYTSYYIWGNSINQLITNYNNDYGSVKNWFNLSSTDNFGFGFTYQNQTTVRTNETVPVSVNIYSGAFPTAYISGNNLEAGNLIVRVW